MVATVNVVEANGATPTWTTVTNVRFQTKDQYTNDFNYPLRIPSSGYYYSYWKSIALDLSGTFTTINNVKHYSDETISWTLGTDGGVFRGDTGLADGSYDQATGTEGTTSD